MTKFIYASILFFITAGLLLLTSCEKDTSLDKTPDKVNEWIYKTMKEHYLWNEELPESFNLSEATPKDYFESLLSEKDGKEGRHYSYIEEDIQTKSTGFEKTHGINSTPFVLRDGDFDVFIQINYITKFSPAEKAGLKRGDWISHYNNQKITQNNFLDFYNFSGDLSVAVGYISNSGFVKLKDVKVGLPEAIEDNPVYLDTTYLVNNKKISYLMYNKFVPGVDNDDQTYNNQLRNAFVKFADHNPDEFILDLRYNPGGLLSCAQLLATMLVDQSALDKVFCKLVYNKTKNSTDEIKLDRAIIETGKNINRKRLYIITGSGTASSSELIINGLKPYMDVILVGEKTEGKNVGSNEFSGKSNNYPWILHPITCLVENAEGFSDYSNGFIPDFPVEESVDSNDLGSTDEYMLKNVLHIIETGNLPSLFRNAESTFKQLPQPPKGRQGIIIE